MKLDGLQIPTNRTWFDTYGTNPVIGWYYQYDLGRQSLGTHKLALIKTSTNFPYTKVSAPTYTYTLN